MKVNLEYCVKKEIKLQEEKWNIKIILQNIKDKILKKGKWGLKYTNFSRELADLLKD